MKFLSFKISKMLIESLVMSRINYYCSLNYGLSAILLNPWIESLDHR